MEFISKMQHFVCGNCTFAVHVLCEFYAIQIGWPIGHPIYHSLYPEPITVSLLKETWGIIDLIALLFFEKYS